jgi:hypothetical protein
MKLSLLVANIAMFIALAACSKNHSDEAKVDSQISLDNVPFQFQADHANAAYSLSQCDPKWQAQMSPSADSVHAQFGFRCGDGHVLSIQGYPQSAFQIGGTILYFANFQPLRTGCEVVAYDLSNGNEIWRTPLEGIAKSGHEQYRNRVTVDLANQSDRGVVTITGNETGGDYVEVLDQKTGKQLAHRIYRQSAG